MSIVNILRDGGQNYLFFFFFSCVLREQKKKNEARVLTLYQDALILSLLKDANNDSIKTPRTNFDPPRSRLT